MLASLLLICVLLFLVCIHVKAYVKRRQYHHIPSHPVPLRWSWILGHSLLVKGRMFRLNKPGFDSAFIFESLRCELESKTVVFFFLRHIMMYTIELPLIARAFSDHSQFKKPRRHRMEYVNGERIFGPNGLLNETGSKVWYQKRKKMDPAFKKKFLRYLMSDMNTSANKMCKFLNETQNKNSIEIYSVMMRVALEVVCTGGFNLRDDFIMTEDSELSKATTTVFSVISTATLHFMDFWLPWKYREEKKSLKDATHLLRNTMKHHLSSRINELNDNPEGISTNILDHVIQGKMIYQAFLPPSPFVINH